MVLFVCFRQLVFCALAVLAEERNPLECLDAFGATGETAKFSGNNKTALKTIQRSTS